MKSFINVAFDSATCQTELEELRDFVAGVESLSEQRDILPFFRSRKQLSAFIGTYHPRMTSIDLLAFEYDIFGDFTADLVIGDSRTSSFLFVEFEDMTDKSIFRKLRGKHTPEWARRFEHGASQIVDWLWKISDMRQSADFINRFGSRNANIETMLVLGNTNALSQRELARLRWRTDQLLVDSKKIWCLGFDSLASDLLSKLDFFRNDLKSDVFEN